MNADDYRADDSRDTADGSSARPKLDDLAPVPTDVLSELVVRYGACLWEITSVIRGWSEKGRRIGSWRCGCARVPGTPRVLECELRTAARTRSGCGAG